MHSNPCCSETCFAFFSLPLSPFHSISICFGATFSPNLKRERETIKKFMSSFFFFTFYREACFFLFVFKMPTTTKKEKKTPYSYLSFVFSLC